MRHLSILVLLTLCLSVGCSGTSSPDDVAITFLELYVFSVDQAAARELAIGLAAEKLTAEIIDVAAVRGRSFEPGQRPPISRELIDTQWDGDARVIYTYHIEVRPKSGRSTRQRMLIQVERADIDTRSDDSEERQPLERAPVWRVADYQFWPDVSSPGTCRIRLGHLERRQHGRELVLYVPVPLALLEVVEPELLVLRYPGIDSRLVEGSR
jgi:hypothetical protein